MEVEGGANECGIWIVFDVVDGSRRYGIDVTSDSCLLLLIMPQFTCLVVILMLSRPMLSFQYVSGLHVAPPIQYLKHRQYCSANLNGMNSHKATSSRQ